MIRWYTSYNINDKFLFYAIAHYWTSFFLSMRLSKKEQFWGGGGTRHGNQHSKRSIARQCFITCMNILQHFHVEISQNFLNHRIRVVSSPSPITNSNIPLSMNCKVGLVISAKISFLFSCSQILRQPSVSVEDDSKREKFQKWKKLRILNAKVWIEKADCFC